MAADRSLSEIEALAPLPPGYRIEAGSRADRTCLLLWLRQTYQELLPQPPTPAAIADLVDRLWTADALLWWVFAATETQPIAGLWLGWAIDPHTGTRRAQLFWVFVCPAHRRRGIATALMRVAEAAARQAGCDRLGLQVDAHNPAAIGLYQALGYVTRSLELVKSLES